ncbi:MAG: coproporphyrinogen dehydrogenase HemZ [Candidatus Mcinerneyibacterium aminivorans]|uniref:Coproporphyrinogen dehydrogenase HemZ n=1 Tax=Candidatus Mcinerneyibacterium aminivorans TaxID=2703815 RepID=A0A5D0ME86_9BACT|nr:MAG: coproporphyrinogen dehydrogenase HemZ [Candidatus Mcinerneyibacterium aminivorans]
MFKKNILLKLDKYFRTFFFIYLGIIFYLSSLTSVGNTGIFNFAHSDKIIHFVEYSILAVIGYIGFRKYRNYKIKLLIFGVLFAFSDELHQLFVPTRVFDLVDFSIDIFPFVILQFIQNPLDINTIKIKGLYRNKIYELFRSIINDIDFRIKKGGEFTVWIRDNFIYYFYKGNYFYKTKCKKCDPKELKKEIYLDLKNFLSRDISKWGLIYMTRPIKKLHYMQGSLNEKRTKLKKDYLVSREKAELLIKLYNIEKKILNTIDKNTKALYINIPFCPTKCAYCSFTSYSLKTFSKYYEEFISCLKKEIKKKLSNNDSSSIKIIYFGGGTPMSLKKEDLKDILELIDNYINKNQLIEYSFEGGRPELFNDDKLALLKRYGVNRIAINPQSLNSSTLNKIERDHSIQDFYNAYNKTIKYDFDIINSDIILGLPGENYMHHISTIKKLLELKRINNITVHILSPKKGSKLYQKGYDYNKSVSKSHKKIKKILQKQDFEPYYLYKQRHILDNLENIGYAKNFRYSYYNIIMISETNEIIGAGTGASSKILKGEKVITQRNPKGLVEYIKTIKKEL